MPDESAEVLIRDALPADAATIIRFNQSLAYETERKLLDPQVVSLGVFAALADPSKLRYWLAEVGGELAGQAAISTEWSDWRNGRLWWFQSVYVESAHRGKGVFRALHQYIRAEAKSDPTVIGLRLYVEDHNIRAQKTYEALGMIHGGYQVFEELWINPRLDGGAGLDG